MNQQSGDTPEFSHLVALDSLGSTPKRISLSAGESERKALAERFDLVSINVFTAEVAVRRMSGTQLVHVDASFVAEIVQTCVVTHDPVPAHVEETLSARFGPDEGIGLEVEIDPEDEDPPEPFENDAIELGEWLAQSLAVAMDPYPRALDASLDGVTDEEVGDESPTHRPFESLLARKKHQA